jgi:hypothetical protein
MDAVLRPWYRWLLRGTRLRRLLARRHVDLDLYLASLPAAQVRAQVAACGRCSSAERCERALKSLAAGTSEYRFCPNRDAFAPFVDSAGIRWRNLMRHPRGGPR